ncbi:MAG: hypothetical protein OXI57_11895 [Rhodospirillales bacterium]|nr:hypothetical protein [Rhodospirillales bacterium]
MALVDKAHNAGTPLSFVTLARFAPSLILELTAKPQTEHEPARDQHAANILHSVSATGLRTGAMIKTPIALSTDRDSRKAIGVACDCRAALEQAARAEAIPETREAGNSIRRQVR